MYFLLNCSSYYIYFHPYCSGKILLLCLQRVSNSGGGMKTETLPVTPLPPTQLPTIYYSPQTPSLRGRIVSYYNNHPLTTMITLILASMGTIYTFLLSFPLYVSIDNDCKKGSCVFFGTIVGCTSLCTIALLGRLCYGAHKESRREEMV